MQVKKITHRTLQKLIQKIADKAGYDILDNRRLVFNRNPSLYYQPDLTLLKKSSLIVVEVELTTDSRKSLTGDIVRAGLSGAKTFIGIVKDSKTANAIEKYGEVLTDRICEMSELKTYGLAVNDREFVDKLKLMLK
ncbi:MAG: hypothetical protein ACKKMW_02340 [Candidatus Nealsonbacteria bacterium]